MQFRGPHPGEPVVIWEKGEQDRPLEQAEMVADDDERPARRQVLPTFDIQFQENSEQQAGEAAN